MFFKKIIFFCLSTLFFLKGETTLLGAENPFLLPPDVNSVSHSEGATAPFLNPVFSDFPNPYFFSYRYLHFNEKNNGNHFLTANFYQTFFSYSWHNVLKKNKDSLIETDTSLFSIQRGLAYDYFGFGGGVTFSKSEENQYDQYYAWNLGFLYRPCSFLSLGLALRDLWAEIASQKIKREEIYSVSWRPWKDRLSLSLDAHRLDGQNFSDLKYNFSSEIRIIKDIQVSFQTDDDFNLKFGITLPFFSREKGNSSILLDAYQTKNKKSPLNYSSVGIALPRESYQKGFSLDSSDNFLLIELREKLKENAQDGRNFFEDEVFSFYDFLQAIKKATNDQSIKGIILQIDSVLYGFAQIQEIREQLKIFKAAGKEVYALMTSIGNKEYFLATIADKIYLTPSNSFAFTGLSAEVYFFKGLLDKAGVKFDSIKHGKYKSFNEAFTRKKMSAPFKSNLTSLLSDLNQQFLEAIKEGRKISQAEIDFMFSQGVLKPQEALAHNFVDALGYQEKILTDLGEETNLLFLENFISEKKKKYKWGPAPQIAVVYLDGSIARGNPKKSSYSNFMGDEKYCLTLEEAFQDETVKAIVIRVNSGGGSAVASDLMWNCLKEFKNQYQKPVVFSFGDMAASGGYYVACSGDKIFASPGSVVGSIGVFSGKITTKELYKKLGINKETIKLSEFADLFSEEKDLTPQEKKVLQAGVDYIYDRFTEKVMSARNLSSQEIEEAAEGRVFTGKQGKKKKLIDNHGGLLIAIEYAVSLAKIEEEYEVKLLPSETVYSFQEFIYPEMKLFFKYLKILIPQAALNLTEEKNLYLYPYQIEIK